MSVVIAAHQVSKTLGNKTLFSGLSLAIHQDERLGLVGPNGAGKSTLLRLFAGLEDVDAGDVYTSKGLRIGYLSQSPQLEKGSIESCLLSVCEDVHDAQALSDAQELISKLDLDRGGLSRETPVNTLSGGQVKKVALARELMRHPDVLLLDEPTNHLDIENIMWLEGYLEGLTHLTLVTVTHDRMFLQNVANVIVDLDPRYQEGYIRVDGSYAEYLDVRSTRLASQQAQESARANDLRREMAWLQRGARARTTKAKARIQHTYALADEVAGLRQLNTHRALEMSLSHSGKTPQKLLEAKGLTKRFGDRVIFSNLNLTLRAKGRLGLLGRNGAGKSTLIKTLLGELLPDAGSVTRADGLYANTISQHRDLLDPKATVLTTLAGQSDYVSAQGRQQHVASYLERFRFRKEQFQRRVETLSGGEQARLLLAKLMLKEAPLWILDEPTNDLDLETLEVLRDALVSFEGAVILVSHDRLFLEQVCDTLLAFPDPDDLVEDEPAGTLVFFESFLQWQAWKDERRQRRERPREAQSVSAKSAQGAAAKPEKLSYKEQRDYADIPAELERLESELAELERAMSDPAKASDAQHLLQTSEAMAKLQARIEERMERWAFLDDKQTKGGA